MANSAVIGSDKSEVADFLNGGNITVTDDQICVLILPNIALPHENLSFVLFRAMG
jgi:hypothetical protein